MKKASQVCRDLKLSPDEIERFMRATSIWKRDYLHCLCYAKKMIQEKKGWSRWMSLKETNKKTNQLHRLVGMSPSEFRAYFKEELSDAKLRHRKRIELGLTKGGKQKSSKKLRGGNGKIDLSGLDKYLKTNQSSLSGKGSVWTVSGGLPGLGKR